MGNVTAESSGMVWKCRAALGRWACRGGGKNSRRWTVRGVHYLSSSGPEYEPAYYEAVAIYDMGIGSCPGVWCTAASAKGDSEDAAVVALAKSLFGAKSDEELEIVLAAMGDES